MSIVFVVEGGGVRRRLIFCLRGACAYFSEDRYTIEEDIATLR